MDHKPSPALPPSLKTSALVILGVVFAAALVFYQLVGPHLTLGRWAVAFAGFLLLMIFTVVVRALPHHPHNSFGAANAITAIRTAIVSLVTAAVFFAADMASGQSAVWILIALVLTALALDGFDGYLARNLGRESALGARFDMEIDALLILVLSEAALMLGKAGWWVLAIGLMRYIFVGAQFFVPALCLPLPPSFRRKLICVVQVATLCVILVPAVIPPVSTVAALIALGLLSYSFAVDIIFLLRKGRQ
ncbi:CDP-alcohol phosphatidyltransferase family protein [Martelella soudanensis]|uniref:CDP-alcohol phosphatidyltransferase family protein n=1 Tax=unclassified Martelella TaxID=2629616 RepID=UPI0015DF2906|nr:MULTISPECIES: CDP-alcohol phosphatidyltransferase family protein [unclassified Martelella]